MRSVPPWLGNTPDAKIPARLRVLANDANAVHINLLRGSLARPSVEQIIHIYGADALRAALTASIPDSGEPG